MWECDSSLAVNKSMYTVRITHTPHTHDRNADLDMSLQRLNRLRTFYRSHLHLVDVGWVVP